VPSDVLSPQAPVLDPVEEAESIRTERWLVTVFDNDYNTFDEVMEILMLATGCCYDEAATETWEIHNLGKSVVHVADEDECRSVAGKIREIGIEVVVSKEL
jgi:ATP-dependent Clp protease adapter protein ClpS